MTSLTAFVVLLIVAVPSGAAAASLGSLEQPPGLTGCVSFDGASILGPNTCGKARMSNTTDVVLSPDGKFAYSVGYGTPQELITIFKRNVATGGLIQLKGKSGCLSQDGGFAGTPNQCLGGRAIGSGDGHSLALSKDGKFLYDASQDDGSAVSANGAVAIFKRNAKNGKLSQLAGKSGCVSTNGESNAGINTCAKGRSIMGGISSVSLSPDQKSLYVTTYPGATDHPGIAIFRRNAKNGRITQLKGKPGCITKDGATVTEMSGCAKAPNVSQVFELGFAGKHVYVPNRDDDLVAVLKRAKSGALSPVTGKAGCISDSGTGALGVGVCNRGKGFGDVERVVVSPDEKFLYFNSYGPTAIAMARRNPKTGALTQKDSIQSCLNNDGSSINGPGSCMDGRGLSQGYAGTLSQDGLTLLYAQPGNDGVVIFRLNPEDGFFKQLPGKEGCVSSTGASEDGAGTCRKARGIDGAYAVTSGPVGSIYVAGDNSASIGRFKIRSCRAKGTKPGARALKVKVECGSVAKVKVSLTISKAKSRDFGIPRLLGTAQKKVKGTKSVTLKLTPKARKGLGRLNKQEAKGLRGRLVVSGYDSLGKGSEVARDTPVR